MKVECSLIENNHDLIEEVDILTITGYHDYVSHPTYNFLFFFLFLANTFKYQAAFEFFFVSLGLISIVVML